MRKRIRACHTAKYEAEEHICGGGYVHVTQQSTIIVRSSSVLCKSMPTCGRNCRTRLRLLREEDTCMSYEEEDACMSCMRLRMLRLAKHTN